MNLKHQVCFLTVIEPLEEPLPPNPTVAEEASENVVNIDDTQPTTANDSVTSAKKIITASRHHLKSDYQFNRVQATYTK